VSVRRLQNTAGMNKSLLVLLCVAGCTSTPSSAEDVNRPGTWNVTFTKLVDVDGPPYTEQQPDPAYPPRVMAAPTIDASGCSPGCTCEWTEASDDCEGDVGETCHAIGGFKETCHSFITGSDKVLDCSELTFETDTSTAGVCVLYSSQAPYENLARYWITLDRATY
jgi:hypothetical protein